MKAKKIDLLKKKEFDKSILSDAFNTQDENILHLVVSHPISSVLDEQNGNAMSAMSGGMCSGLLINKKANVKSGESEEEAIICIREIGINYFGNSFEDGTTSGEVVHSHNDITGINIWECYLMISKWISYIISLFKHVNIVHNGTNQRPNQVIIIGVNPPTPSDMSHNVLLNEELFGHLDSAWRSKSKNMQRPLKQ
ncbi:hypothetical protein PCYB_003910 [Plasmodium cynomolgi strain B]|uniref:Uncharacterized protein n=1 Tax=Plasmodium cynomolgi (strain B) TaxID=1120755 RepID=K6VJQ1_PLACD|nr:hypothetical protein PCYB_003910 [Plasmodium cynomolgi strain B]GAB69642.1 hypothetical protein PCYB_003910 [Plasmodium cynomolgi strain B]